MLLLGWFRFATRPSAIEVPRLEKFDLRGSVVLGLVLWTTDASRCVSLETARKASRVVHGSKFNWQLDLI